MWIDPQKFPGPALFQALAIIAILVAVIVWLIWDEYSYHKAQMKRRQDFLNMTDKINKDTFESQKEIYRRDNTKS